MAYARDVFDWLSRRLGRSAGADPRRAGTPRQCECPCHRDPSISHCVPCCLLCPGCGIRFRAGFDRHERDCGAAPELELRITDSAFQRLAVGAVGGAGAAVFILYALQLESLLGSLIAFPLGLCLLVGALDVAQRVIIVVPGMIHRRILFVWRARKVSERFSFSEDKEWRKKEWRYFEVRDLETQTVVLSAPRRTITPEVEKQLRHILLTKP